MKSSLSEMASSDLVSRASFLISSISADTSVELRKLCNARFSMLELEFQVINTFNNVMLVSSVFKTFSLNLHSGQKVKKLFYN